jgi:hypothetical protein
MQHSDRTGPLRPVIFIATIIRSHHHRRQYCNGCALVSSARAFCSCYLQRGHAEKCETGTTIDFPTLRHVVGIGRWCSQLTRPRRPQRHRRKTKARHLGLDTSEGVLGPSFFHSESAIAERGRKKSRHTPASFGLSDWPSPFAERKSGDEVKT